MSVRDDIAAAASQTADVEIVSYYRQTLTSGYGFVKWARRDRDDSGLGWIDTWQVWVGLPQDVKASEKWLEGHLAELVSNVDEELVVTVVSPAELVLDGGSTNGLIIEGTRSAA